jgi:electron transport complex protein RnfB
VKDTLADRIDAVLPQTQCTRCGFDGCRPYAEAVANASADINRCPPGGGETIRRLASLTARPASALDPACGVFEGYRVARIDEARCIGCTLCIDACPVDAILGAARQMHVVVPTLCSGCELCLAPCPVDCIAMTAADRAWEARDAAAARARHDARRERLARRERVADRGSVAPDVDVVAARRSTVAEALARARARREASRARGDATRAPDE